MKDVSLPFVQYEIIQLTSSQKSQKEILEIFANKISNMHHASVEWGLKGNTPILKIVYPDFETYQNAYNRNVPFLEKILMLLNKNEIFLDEIKLREYANPSPLTDPKHIFMIIKMNCNYKAPIRKNYDFAFKFGELVGISSQFEEIEDGFLVFYEHEVDFDDMQVDKLNINELKLWLERKGKWNVKAANLIQTLFNIK